MNIPLYYPGPWNEYELIDTGDGQKLERFGKYQIVRPDPSIMWPVGDSPLWEDVDARFDVATKKWNVKTSMPQNWEMAYQDLKFTAKLTPFKHLGVFPEQAVNWDFITRQITNANRPTSVLNLFGYTGLASLITVKTDANVCHVDASQPAINWAKENQKLSGLETKPIRWILDDCAKFVKREIKRGNKYDGIIMDPPSFGHDPSGKPWKFNADFPELLKDCVKLLSDKPLFLIVNAYAVSTSSITLHNVLQSETSKLGGQIEFGELALKESKRGLTLSTGIFARWSAKI